MECLILVQSPDPPPVPPALLNLGAGVVTVYIAMLIIKAALDFAKKGGPAQQTSTENLIEFRINQLDERLEACITRNEYNSRNEDISRQLADIKTLVQQLYSTRLLFDPKLPKGGG
jgi:hypothetical protein